MKRNKLKWTPRPRSGIEANFAAVAGPPPVWPGDPTLAPRDELIFLLQTASEVEHALMAQYLFAAWSVPSDYPLAAVANDRWRALLMRVAKQEMGHLITVQNLLRSLRAPLTLDREDYPFRSSLYPFDFTLERLTLSSLAKYVLAEMPENAVFPAGVTLEEVHAAAGMDAGGHVNRVGLLFEHLMAIVENHTTDADFSPESLPLQARPLDWRADGKNGVIVMPVGTKAEALAALRAIAEQGEGLEAPSAGAPPSHFDIFVRLFRERRDAVAAPVAQIPANPNTSPASEGAEFAAGRILNQRSRLWALLGNLHYRMLLTCIRHSLSLPNGNEDETIVREHSFEEMVAVGVIGGLLARLPQGDDASPSRAGLPLEMPYSLDFPDSMEGDTEMAKSISKGVWLLHRDLLTASSKLINTIRDLGPASVAEETQFLTMIEESDSALRKRVDAALGPGPVLQITALRILPAIAIARFGSSTTPLENYDLGPAGSDGWHPIVPAETLAVDAATGRITGAATPAEIKFRDAAGLIKPVCPFLEVWAQFTPDGPLQPLTTTHLEQLGLSPASLRWQVRAANLKAQRRTGDSNDGIHADTGAFSDHAVHSLQGTCVNFKAGKSIPFGSVRYVEPTTEFPEMRLRFTPASGKVFGPNAGDPDIPDVYDAERGTWFNHIDGLTDRPRSTVPGSIFFGRGEFVDFDGDGNPDDFFGNSDPDRLWHSNAYLDDACDAVISVEVTLGERVHRAEGRVASGPPHFSPDTLPMRTVGDEIEQWIEGPNVPAPRTPQEAQALAERAAEIIRRALGTVRLMNTRAMNTGGMAAHNTNDYERAREPIFADARAVYAAVEERHRSVIADLAGFSAEPGSQERARAVDALQLMGEMLREYNKVGDLSNPGRRLMPAMMRNADGVLLALTRRQRETVIRAAEALSTPSVPQPGTPEQNMLALVRELQSGANRHGGVTTGNGTLRDLFADPPRLLDYLRTGLVQTEDALLGQPLLVPGNPSASAFVKIIEDSDHAMFSRFTAVQPDIGGMTGAAIVRAWIASLPVA